MLCVTACNTRKLLAYLLQDVTLMPLAMVSRLLQALLSPKLRPCISLPMLGLR